MKKLQEAHNKSLTDMEMLKQELKMEREDKEVWKQEVNQLNKELEDIRRELRAQPSNAPEQSTLASTQPETMQTEPKPNRMEDAHHAPELYPTQQPSTSSETPPTNNVSSHIAHQDTNRPQEHLSPEIVLLIDSNGRYIDEKKLFPHHRVRKIKCQNTRQAMELLSEENLGSPTHIIIHTGTNDLSRHTGENVAQRMKKVVDKATSTFPTSRVTISALLPRWDFDPNFMQRLNAQISRDCALKENVFLACHPSLDHNSLYDTVHILKERVPDFARSLKDVALNRRPATSHRSSNETNMHRRRTAASGSTTRQPAAPLRAAKWAATPLPPRHTQQHPTYAQAASSQPNPHQPTSFSQHSLPPPPTMPTPRLQIEGHSHTNANITANKTSPWELTMHQMITELYSTMVQSKITGV